MKFITAEQFSKADKNVRDSIMEWWEPNIGDLVESTMGNEVWCLINSMQVDRALSAGDSDSYVIPLLTVGQLIEFIEWKTEGRLDIRHTFAGENILKVWTIFEGYISWDYEITGTDTLINRLWDMVQKVCE